MFNTNLIWSKVEILMNWVISDLSKKLGVRRYVIAIISLSKPYCKTPPIIFKWINYTAALHVQFVDILNKQFEPLLEYNAHWWDEYYKLKKKK